MKHSSLIGVNLLIKKERIMLQGKYYMNIDKFTFLINKTVTQKASH